MANGCCTLPIYISEITDDRGLRIRDRSVRLLAICPEWKSNRQAVKTKFGKRTWSGKGLELLRLTVQLPSLSFAMFSYYVGISPSNTTSLFSKS
jgi:hypothetical protein